MCDPVTAGLILTAASGGASAINQQSALKRQDREAARGLRAQGEIQRGANQRVNEEIGNIAGATGAEEQAASLADFQNALRAGQSGTTGALDAVPGASDRFAERVEAGKGDLKTRADAKVQNLSVIDGILRQRINEGQNIGRTGSDLSAIRNDSRGQDFLTQLRVNEQRPNPLVDALAGVGKGLGSGLALRAPKLADPLQAAVRSGTIVDPITNPSSNPFLNA